MKIYINRFNYVLRRCVQSMELCGNYSEITRVFQHSSQHLEIILKQLEDDSSLTAADRNQVFFQFLEARQEVRKIMKDYTNFIAWEG